MKIKYIMGLIAVLLCSNVQGQQTPGPAQTDDILILGATAHIGDGTIIENSAIGFKEGKIVYVGTSSEVNRQDFSKVIDAQGKHVYPGFIAPNSSLGLVEVDAVKASSDLEEIGDFNPSIRAIVAYNAESKIVESCRPNGVLTAQVTPRGGYIAGNSTVVQLDAWNYEDAGLSVDDGMHIYWPSTSSYSYRSGRVRYNDNYKKEVKNIVDYLRSAKVYLASSKDPQDLKMDALNGVFGGSQNLYIHTNGARQMLDAMQMASELGLNNYVFVGAFEAYKITDQLKAKNVPVLLKRVHSLPNSEDEDVRLPFKVAAELVNAGILVGLENTGDMERMQTRNLPFYAGTIAGYGLSYEEALSLITLNTAKILNIDNFCGSLSLGKDATLFVSEGNALEMTGNKVTEVFIQGRIVSLETHQTELYHRYSEKYSSKK